MKKTLNAQRRNEMNAITIEIQMRFAFLQLQLASVSIKPLCFNYQLVLPIIHTLLELAVPRALIIA